MSNYSEILEQLLIEAGASIWEKESIKRIYINDAVAQKVFNENILKEFSSCHIKVGKAKFFLDCKSNQLHADSGTIRSRINGTTYEHGLTCRA